MKGRNIFFAGTTYRRAPQEKVAVADLPQDAQAAVAAYWQQLLAHCRAHPVGRSVAELIEAGEWEGSGERFVDGGLAAVATAVNVARQAGGAVEASLSGKGICS